MDAATQSTASQIRTGQTVQWSGRQGLRRLKVTQVHRVGDLVQINGTDPTSANDERQAFLSAERTVLIEDTEDVS